MLVTARGIDTSVSPPQRRKVSGARHVKEVEMDTERRDRQPGMAERWWNLRSGALTIPQVWQRISMHEKLSCHGWKDEICLFLEIPTQVE